MEENNSLNRIKINISGMSCRSCERRIKVSLEKLPGVRLAEVSYRKSMADVEVDLKLTARSAIFLAISKLGYKITGDSQNSSSYPAPAVGERESVMPGPSGPVLADESSGSLTIPITGMHCRSCEMRLEDQFMTQKGVVKAKADFRNGSLVLLFEKGYALKDGHITHLVELCGYTVGKSTTKLTFLSKNLRDYQDLGIALVILLTIYTVIRATGLGGPAPSTASKSFSLPIISLIGLTAGFSTCMALVGGLVLGISARMSEAHPNATPGEKFRPHLFFCSGRILSYILLGGILGLVGSVFQFSSFSLGILTIGIGIVMLIMGIQLIEIFPWSNCLKFTLPKAVSRKFGATSTKNYSHGNSMLLGALTFFLPCGFTQAMQVYAIGTGSFFDGALTMGAFVVGTVPGLLGIGGLTSIVKGVFARRFFKLAGLAVICFSIFNISNGIGLSGISIPSAGQSTAVLNDPNVTVENGVQVVRMKENAGGYEPNNFTIQNAIPVKWIIEAAAPLSCAASMVVPKYGIRKNLSAGENIITFSPDKAGTIKFSCSMGMYTGAFTVVDPDGGKQAYILDGKEDSITESQTQYSVAKASDSIQFVESSVTAAGYQPIVVQRGIPVEWTIVADSMALNACNKKIRIPDLKIERELNAGNTTVRFTAPDTGAMEFTCAKNMTRSIIMVVDNISLCKLNTF